MKFDWKVLSAIFVFSLILGFIQALPLYLEIQYLSSSTFQTLNELLELVEVATSVVVPLLVLLSFYLLGRKTDIGKSFHSIIFSLSLGSLTGYLVGFAPPFTLLYLSTQFQRLSVIMVGGNLLFTYALYGFKNIVLVCFCGGFTALSLGYFVKERSLTNAKQTPKEIER